jgi:hypothetical protein
VANIDELDVFADHGDGGAVVFLLYPNKEEEENNNTKKIDKKDVNKDVRKLYPVGLLVSGKCESGLCSFLSLKDVFQSFCDKQHLNEFEIGFENPKLDGKMLFPTALQTTSSLKLQNTSKLLPSISSTGKMKKNLLKKFSK